MHIKLKLVNNQEYAPAGTLKVIPYKLIPLTYTEMVYAN